MKTQTDDWKKNIIEKWANIEHKRWAKWQKYMHNKMRLYEGIDSENQKYEFYILDRDDYNHWEKQINTDYKDLSEQEKESDRKEVYPYLEDIKKLLTRQEIEIKNKMIKELKKLQIGVFDSTPYLKELIEKFKI